MARHAASNAAWMPQQGQAAARRSAGRSARRRCRARAGRPAPGTRRDRPAQAIESSIGPGSAPGCSWYCRSTYAIARCHRRATAAGRRCRVTRPDRPERVDDQVRRRPRRRRRAGRSPGRPPCGPRRRARAPTTNPAAPAAATAAARARTSPVATACPTISSTPSGRRIRIGSAPAASQPLVRLRQLGLQCRRHLPAERVGVVELHHAAPPPGPSSDGPASRSTDVTAWPRRARAAPRNRPVGPDPMMATRIASVWSLPHDRSAAAHLFVPPHPPQHGRRHHPARGSPVT